MTIGGEIDGLLCSTMSLITIHARVSDMPAIGSWCRGHEGDRI